MLTSLHTYGGAELYLRHEKKASYWPICMDQSELRLSCSALSWRTDALAAATSARRSSTVSCKHAGCIWIGTSRHSAVDITIGILMLSIIADRRRSEHRSAHGDLHTSKELPSPGDLALAAQCMGEHSRSERLRIWGRWTSMLSRETTAWGAHRPCRPLPSPSPHPESLCNHQDKHR